MRILMVTLFFPPTGGGGVQRSLEFAGHLAELGFETYVVAPDDSKRPERDVSLPLPPHVRVLRARNFSPATGLLGAELYGTKGLQRLAVHARFGTRRVLAPDPSIVWTLTALPAVVRLIRRARIDVVLTTSPPPSVNLVGASAKRLTGIPWVADVRDSIAFDPHRRWDVRGEPAVARLVARYADAVVAASRGIAAEMTALGGGGKVKVVESGCDFEELAGLSYHRGDRLRITHTGSFVGRRDPRPFLDALASTSSDVVARFVGNFRQRDLDHAGSLGLGDRIELLPFVSRHDALRLQRDTDVLLLLVPEADGRGRSVLTGKLFEYLAARRPILAAVPSDGEAAALVRRAEAGVVVAPDDVEGLAVAIRGLRDRWLEGRLEDIVLPSKLESTLSWRTRVERLAEILTDLASSAPTDALIGPGDRLLR